MAPSRRQSTGETRLLTLRKISFRGSSHPNYLPYLLSTKSCLSLRIARLANPSYSKAILNLESLISTFCKTEEAFQENPRVVLDSKRISIHKRLACIMFCLYISFPKCYWANTSRNSFKRVDFALFHFSKQNSCYRSMNSPFKISD